MVCNAGICTPLPRPIAPASTATVSSHRPALQWALAAGSDGVHVELCSDRACTTPIDSFDVTGTTATPTRDLPPGVVFWRLFARVGTTQGTISGPTWEFWVGARSAPVDTSRGSTLDVNGDGHPDLAVGLSGVNSITGAVDVYLGTATGLPCDPVEFFDGPDGPFSAFGGVLANAGDVNGDGYSDLIVGTCDQCNGYPGAARAYVYHGGPTGLSPTPATTLVQTAMPSGEALGTATGVGDVDRDGYADVVVGVPGADRAYLYLGSATGIRSSPSVTLSAPGTSSNGSFGSAVAGAGDVDGDGFADVVIGAPGQYGSFGAAFYFRGGSNGLPSTPTVTFDVRAVEVGRVGGSVASAGDVNGDGYADVVIGAEFDDQALVFLGAATGLPSAASLTLVGPDAQGSEFGAVVATAGDVDGDGYDEIAVSADHISIQTGILHVYAGGAAGLGTTPTTLANAGPSGDGFGDALAAADFDSDGRADLAVGAPILNYGTGRVYLYPGSATGLPAQPPMFRAAGGPGGNFGGALAAAK